MANLNAGDVLGNVLLGCLLQDVVVVWTGDGARHFFSVEEPERLSGLLAKGIAARTSPEPGRFRETALLNSEENLLLLAGRLFESTGGASVSAPAANFRVKACDEPSPDEALWTATSRWLTDAVVAAVGRGEFIVVEKGGWEAIPEPYAFACASRGPEGQWLSHIEAAPLPATPSWKAAYSGPTDARGATITAPATDEAFTVAGIFLAEAVSTWAHSPFEVVLTFGASPSGPWPG
jgi:hypothetical protein